MIFNNDQRGAYMQFNLLMKSKPVWITTLVCIGLVAMYFLVWSDHKISRREQEPAQVTSAVKLNAANSATASMRSPIAGVPGGTTYLPGLARSVKASAGNLYSDENIKGKRWWLYATSEDDAKWLDRYGYPTPAEEERLEKASDIELAALVASGDLNAKAIQAVREAKKAFLTGTFEQIRVKAYILQRIVVDGGPYQALATMRGFGEILQLYSDIPEEQQTDAQRKALQELDIPQQIARGFLAAYGDQNSVNVSYNTMRFPAQRVDSRLKAPDLSAMSVMISFAASARRREEQNQPPLTIVPRPEMSIGQSTMIYERY